MSIFSVFRSKGRPVHKGPEDNVVDADAYRVLVERLCARLDPGTVAIVHQNITPPNYRSGWNQIKAIFADHTWLIDLMVEEETKAREEGLLE